jgi:hypothetical protein
VSRHREERGVFRRTGAAASADGAREYKARRELGTKALEVRRPDLFVLCF